LEALHKDPHEGKLELKTNRERLEEFPKMIHDQNRNQFPWSYRSVMMAVVVTVVTVSCAQW
jgi:hypothetical protein